MPAYYARPGRPRSGGRLARSPQLAADLSARLTARDRWLLRMLHEHRVLTTAQVTQLAFGTTRAATTRLAVLHQGCQAGWAGTFRAVSPSNATRP